MPREITISVNKICEFMQRHS